MGKQKVTGADALVGKLSAKGDISASSGSISCSSSIVSLRGSVGACSQGFTVASVAWRVARVPISAATTGERTYAFTFPVGAIVKRVYLDVATAEATASDKTIDVGLLSSETAGDADGFLDGASTAAANVVSGNMVASARTLGVLLYEGTAASIIFRRDHIISGANATTLSSKVAEAQTELAGDIVVEYLAVG